MSENINYVINPIFQAGLEIQETFRKKNWKFCYIGGLAVLRWGEFRMTQDIDLCLLSGFGNERKYITDLLKIYKPRIKDTEKFALENRILLLSASNGVSVDITFSGLFFEEKMIENATLFSFTPECSLITCSAEDLIIMKAFADRPKDWIDVEGIISRQNKNINEEYIFKNLIPLCEVMEKPEILQKLKSFFR